MYHSNLIQTKIFIYYIKFTEMFFSIFLFFLNSTSSLMAVKYWTLSFQVWFSSSISKEIFTLWYAFIYFHSLYIFLPQYKFSRKIYFLLFNKLLFIFSIRRNIFLDVILFKFSFIYNLLRHDITYLPSKSLLKNWDLYSYQ